MPDAFSYTPLSEALSIVAAKLAVKPVAEQVGVRVAYGRILSRDVHAREDVPRLPTSHFDGFAMVAVDAAGASGESPVQLLLRPGTVPVGASPKAPLGRGQAQRVLTGGYLPRGADSVLPKEEATELGRVLQVSRPVEEGEHVYPAGGDVRRGETVMRAGKALTGQDLVLLASLRFERVTVLRRPRVAILPTGTELTTDFADRRPGKVLETHSLLLERVVTGAGGLPTTLPIVRDDAGHVLRALKKAIAAFDLVLTLAGSSVGEPDLVDSAIRSFGRSNTALVHGVRVNRGRVMGCAVVRGKPVVILPGPIQGALNAFIVLAYPLIRLQLGRGLETPPWVPATVDEAWEASGKFKDFDQVVYLTVRRDPSGSPDLVATPSGAATEKVSFLTSRNAYALVPGSQPSLSKGERVRAHLLPGFSALE